eukprot:1978589-Rhodomonas_salina.2
MRCHFPARPRKVGRFNGTHRQSNTFTLQFEAGSPAHFVRDSKYECQGQGQQCARLVRDIAGDSGEDRCQPSGCDDRRTEPLQPQTQPAIEGSHRPVDRVERVDQLLVVLFESGDQRVCADTGSRRS